MFNAKNIGIYILHSVKSYTYLHIVLCAAMLGLYSSSYAAGHASHNKLQQFVAFMITSRPASPSTVKKMLLKLGVAKAIAITRRPRQWTFSEAGGMRFGPSIIAEVVRMNVWHGQLRGVELDFYATKGRCLPLSMVYASFGRFPEHLPLVDALIVMRKRRTSWGSYSALVPSKTQLAPPREQCVGIFFLAFRGPDAKATDHNMKPRS